MDRGEPEAHDMLSALLLRLSPKSLYCRYPYMLQVVSSERVKHLEFSAAEQNQDVCAMMLVKTSQKIEAFEALRSDDEPIRRHPDVTVVALLQKSPRPKKRKPFDVTRMRSPMNNVVQQS